MELKAGLSYTVLIKSSQSGNGLNSDELQCSKNMMYKANHECILLFGSSVGLAAPSPELSTDCLSQFFHSQYLRPQKNCFNSCKNESPPPSPPRQYAAGEE